MGNKQNIPKTKVDKSHNVFQAKNRFKAGNTYFLKSQFDKASDEYLATLTELRFVTADIVDDGDSGEVDKQSKSKKDLSAILAYAEKRYEQEKKLHSDAMTVHRDIASR